VTYFSLGNLRKSPVIADVATDAPSLNVCVVVVEKEKKTKDATNVFRVFERWESYDKIDNERESFDDQ
jgi:hypothetical protein